jgi:hypothetical protein
MIVSIPAVDQQGHRVNVGDTIMYVTHMYNDFTFHYAKLLEYKPIYRKYVQLPVYGMVVEILNKDLKYSKRTLRNPTFFKCGVELSIPTDTQIEGMQT